jgi:hypothetical protein
MSELPTSPEAESVEVLRAWIVGETMQCALRADAFTDSAAWGAVLADVVRHIAEALQQQEGTPAEQTIQRIRAVFEEEIGASETE